VSLFKLVTELFPPSLYASVVGLRIEHRYS
jgi:hypothetical protein